MDIVYRPEFIKLYNKLESDLQEEVKEKLALFKTQKNLEPLKIHKLHGRLRGRLSFSVNFKYRIIFEYVEKKKVAIVTIGSHDVYK